MLRQARDCSQRVALTNAAGAVGAERPKLPETFEEDTWKQLQLSVRAVHEGQPVEQSFEELYKAVQDLCIHKLGQNLYNRLSAECEQHIQKQVAKLVSQVPNLPVLMSSVARDRPPYPR